MLAIIIFGILLVIICIIASISMKKIFDLIDRKEKESIKEVEKIKDKFKNLNEDK